ncbi:hypothetical protein G6011_10763 [Alternaria panax]|uniref:Uncharacterized protein n=1 Tax=Alternaria panax TaxID=48097 RepID=A0AAD4ICH6_9PLEO|nr:hypothetical protein G6011_10763 [Alternaria panax]
MTLEIQRALLQTWAEDIGHAVGLNNSPKAEFARLAKAKGWTGGDAEWCHYWAKCFNETYSWGLQNRSITTDSTLDADPATQTGTLNLVDHMRTLSVGSDASSFSVISRTSRADSFDSVRSLNSIQSREVGDLRLSDGPRSPSITNSWESTDSRNTVLSLNTVNSLGELSGGVEIPKYNSNTTTDTVVNGVDSSLDISGQDAVENPAWNDFTDFVHRPNAPFKEEFERLALIKGWNRRIKRQNLVALLRTEVEFFWSSDDVDKLECYNQKGKQLSPAPLTNRDTDDEQALRPLKVNLYSVIDHMRNPEIKVVTYKTIRELRLSVRKIGTFPRDCAKAGGGYMADLLSKL